GFEGMLLLSREVLLSFYEKTTKADFLMTVIRYMFIRKQTNTIGKERTAKEWILPDTSSRMNKI
ncbi:MAG: hypothetical protein K2H87_03395, partial [Duncaniella sp.]|nr:hypothetical protein [Duncaniella sp.]